MIIKKMWITLAVFSVSLSSQAIDKFYYDLDTSDYSWSNAANWTDNAGTTLVGVPTAADVVKHVKKPEVTIVVDGPAEADDVILTHNNTASLSVVTGGELHIYDEIKMGTFGTGGGSLSIGGGSVIVDDLIAMSPTSTGSSSIHLSSGSLVVSNQLYMGQKSGSTAVNTFNITGGTADIGTVYVGRFSPGTLNISGGSLVVTNNSWDALRISHEAGGTGEVNLSGGSILTKRIDINAGGGSGGAFNILGGSVEVSESFAAAIRVDSNGVINVSGGQLEWKGNRLVDITNLVAAGSITWTNGMTNMLTDTWDASWTNGESILFADYDEVRPTYTTIWAYDTNPYVPPPQLGPTYYTNDTDGATTSSFINTSDDGLYTTSSNWDSVTVPTRIDTVTHKSIGGDSNILTVPNNVVVEAFSLDVAHNNTAKVSVVTGGNFEIATDVILGNAKSTGVGLLSVDGGSVNVESNLYAGRFASATEYRHGIVEINEGSLTVENESLIGGNASTATGTVNMTGGVYSNNSFFKIGDISGEGTVNVSNALLVVQLDKTVAYNPLRLGNGAGNATLNIYNGGEVQTSGIRMDWDDQTGSAQINLYEGGVLKVTEAWFVSASQGHVQFRDDSKIHIAGGRLHWKFNRASSVQSLVEAGHLTFSGGLTNMLSDTWDYAVTNQANTSALYVKEYLIPEYSVVWSFDLSSVPSGYDAFSAAHNLSGGASDDDDGDQLSNFGEYALNSNPTNASDTGQTTFEADSSTFSVVYTKLANDSSAVYRLLDTTDLVYGSLSTNAYTSQDQSAVSGDYVTVTNHYDMSGKSVQFIELEVEQQ